MKSFFQDILKVNDPEKSGEDRFSLARTLLFISAVLYILATVTGYFLSFFSSVEVDASSLETAIEALKFPVLLFAGYSFSNKVTKYIKDINLKTK